MPMFEQDGPQTVLVHQPVAQPGPVAGGVLVVGWVRSTYQAGETSVSFSSTTLHPFRSKVLPLVPTFRCHWNQAEEIREPLGCQHVVETMFDVGDTKPSCRHHVRIDFQLREAFAREEIHVRTWSEPQVAPTGINDESLLQAVIFADRKKADPFFGFKSKTHHTSLSQQTNQFEICASAVHQHRIKIRPRDKRHHLSSMHRVVYHALWLPEIALR